MLIPHSRVVRKVPASTSVSPRQRDDALSPGVDDRLARPETARPDAVRRGPRPVPWLVIAAASLAAWTLASASGWLGGTFPSPTEVIRAAGQLVASGQLQRDAVVTLAHGAVGLGLGMAVGLLLALAAGLGRWGRYLDELSLRVAGSLLTISALLLTAVVVLAWPALVVVVAVAALPAQHATRAALLAVDTRYVDLATIAGLRGGEVLRDVIWPGATAGFLAGLRLAVALTWLVLLGGDRFGLAGGLGELISAGQAGRAEVLAVALLTALLLWALCDALVRLIERSVLGWQPTDLHR